LNHKLFLFSSFLKIKFWKKEKTNKKLKQKKEKKESRSVLVSYGCE